MDLPRPAGKKAREALVFELFPGVRLEMLVQVISERGDWAPWRCLSHAMARHGRSSQKQRQQALEESRKRSSWTSFR